MRFIFLYIVLFFYNYLSAQSYNWKWIGGDTSNKVQPVYGERNIAGLTSTPGNRHRHVLWLNSNGNLMLYGGLFAINQSNYNSRNDVWQQTTNGWKWIKGYKTFIKEANYGTKGVSLKSNTPNNRYGNLYWNNSKGQLWMYGGSGFDLQGKTGYFNDLWFWDGINWTWINGDSTAYKAPVYGKKGVGHLNNQPGSRYMSATCIDDEGNLWLYGGSLNYLNSDSQKITGTASDLWKWDGQFWTWMGGNSELNVKHSFDSLGAKGNMALSCLYKNMAMWYADGYIWTFGGSDNELVNHVYKWKDDEWTWVHGNLANRPKPIYNQKGVSNSKSSPGARNDLSYCQTPDNRLWLYGGFDSRLKSNFSDLWVWNGNNWIWMAGDTTKNALPVYGALQESSSKLHPGARREVGLTADINGSIYLHGGAAKDKYYADIWQFEAMKPTAKIRVFASQDEIISNSDTAYNIQNPKFIGKASITSTGISKYFTIYNYGNATLELSSSVIKITGADSASFYLAKKPEHLTIAPNDSAHFSVGFKPTHLELNAAKVEILAKNELLQTFQFIVTGIGTKARINLVNEIECSSANLHIANTDAQHHAVFISSTNKKPILKDGQNFSFSPNYLKSIDYDSHTKILYHGPDQNVSITGLVSNRTYFLWVIPGFGKTDSTTFNNDSSQVLIFKTKPSIWQDSVHIYPDKDSIVCPDVKIEIVSTSPTNKIIWHNFLTSNKIPFIADGNYYFVSQDKNECILGSDTILLQSATRNYIQGIQTSKLPPFCDGDTITLQTKPPNYNWFIWNNLKDSNAPSIKVNKNGWHTVTAIDQFNCEYFDSIYLTFNKLPDIKFSSDTAIFDDSLMIEFKSNADSIIWSINHHQSTNLNSIPPPDNSAFLLAKAFNENGCMNADSVLVLKMEFKSGVYPTAFTPNNDNLNEFWYVPKYPKNTYLLVFDRWGELVYNGQNIWDGYKNGKELPVGKYFFILKNSEVSTSILCQGVITLLR
ncbi:MAG: gliding motility-associated C-terminal domain-containing protein [Bacteroidetes bacterium]|nr:gliding motility-associated C-terminal domain-containing protein [Bacteroidota bacterium]